jgi:DUF1680 family protein
MPVSRSAYRPTPLAQVHPLGWLEAQARNALDGYVGAMPALCGEVGGEVFAHGRLGPESDAEGKNVAGVEWWNGESEGNWLLAWCTHVLLLGDDAGIADLGAYLDRVIAAQDDDGYIGMFTPGARAGRDYIGGDLWTQSRVLQALQTFAANTDTKRGEQVNSVVENALHNIAARFSAALASGHAFDAGMGDSCGRGHDLMIVEVLIEQARRTGSEAWVQLAGEIYASYSRASLDWTEADGQLERLLSDEPVVGHGAHTAEHLRVPLLISEFTGDLTLRRAFLAGYKKVVAALGVAGGLKSDEIIAEPGGTPVPLPEAGYEFCAITELAISLLEAARVTGSFDYIERVERLFLNLAQSAIAKDGRSTAYCVAENQPAATIGMGTRWDYSPTHDDVAVCCVPNAGRLLPAVVQRMVMVSERGVSIQMYGPVQVDLDYLGTPVSIRQETTFPFTEDVDIHVDANGSFEVELRLPSWCELPEAEIHGATDVREEWLSDRVRITAEWSGSSLIRLHLPQRLGTVPTVDGRVAVTAGPLIYSVPIPHKTVSHRTYEGSDFVDLDLTPVGSEYMHAPTLLGSRFPEARVAVGGGSGADPWSAPASEVTVMGLNPNPREDYAQGGGLVPIRLVPMGSANLRWTALRVMP